MTIDLSSAFWVVRCPRRGRALSDNPSGFRKGPRLPCQQCFCSSTVAITEQKWRNTSPPWPRGQRTSKFSFPQGKGCPCSNHVFVQLTRPARQAHQSDMSPGPQLRECERCDGRWPGDSFSRWQFVLFGYPKIHQVWRLILSLSLIHVW